MSGGPAEPHILVPAYEVANGTTHLLVGHRAGAGWLWLELMAPSGVSAQVIDATGVRAADGTLRMWAVFGPSWKGGSMFLLQGVGDDWTWQEIDHPGVNFLFPRCIGVLPADPTDPADETRLWILGASPVGEGRSPGPPARVGGSPWPRCPRAARWRHGAS